MAKKRETYLKKQYIIGRGDESFYSFVPEVKGELADDQNLEMARHFGCLNDAIRVAADLGVSVFEIVHEGWPATLRELKVDLAEVSQLPFEGTYRVEDNFLAGPCFLTPSETQSQERIAALTERGVNCIVSLLGRDELFRTRHLLEDFSDASHWQQHFFPIPNGETPRIGQMRLILDTIDRELSRGLTVYLSCIAGRGRTGTVVGCWLRRHGKSEDPLATLAELRWKCGLFLSSPETDQQTAFVKAWKKDQ